jgi:hypothetical protein
MILVFLPAFWWTDRLKGKNFEIIWSSGLWATVAADSCLTAGAAYSASRPARPQWNEGGRGLPFSLA